MIPLYDTSDEYIAKILARHAEADRYGRWSKAKLARHIVDRFSDCDDVGTYAQVMRWRKDEMISFLVD